MAYMLDMALANLIEVLKKAGSKYVVEQGSSESKYLKLLTGDGEHCRCVIRLSYHNTTNKRDFHLGPHKEADAGFKDWHMALPVMRDKAASLEEKEIFGHIWALETVKRQKPNDNFDEILKNIREKQKKKREPKKKKSNMPESILPTEPRIPIRICDVANAIRWLCNIRKCLTNEFQNKQASAFHIDHSTRLGRVNIAVIIGDVSELPLNFGKNAEKIYVGDMPECTYKLNDWEKLFNDINVRLEKIEFKQPKKIINFIINFRTKMLCRTSYK